MNTNDFTPPKNHAYDMLKNYKNAYEKEQVLSLLLSRCIKYGKFTIIETIHNHPTMVDDGLLEKVSDRKYKLTIKAIGLLYSHYGK